MQYLILALFLYFSSGTFSQVSPVDTNSLQSIQREIIQPLSAGDYARIMNKIKVPFYYGAETLSRPMLEARMSEIFTPALCAELSNRTGFENLDSNGTAIMKRCQNGRAGYVCLVVFRLSREGTWYLSGIDMY